MAVIFVDLDDFKTVDAGKGRVARFEPQMRAQLVERIELGSELGLAVERDELFLEYQPLVELDTGGSPASRR
jgi:predicted signal transduction protein with EAL and GGDEF domain